MFLPRYQAKLISPLQIKEMISSYLVFYPFQASWGRSSQGPSRRVWGIREVSERKEKGSSQKGSSGCLLTSGTSGAPEAGQRVSNQWANPSREGIVMETLRAGLIIDSAIFTDWVLETNRNYKQSFQSYLASTNVQWVCFYLTAEQRAETEASSTDVGPSALTVCVIAAILVLTEFHPFTWAVTSGCARPSGFPVRSLLGIRNNCSW